MSQGVAVWPNSINMILLSNPDRYIVSSNGASSQAIATFTCQIISMMEDHSLPVSQILFERSVAHAICSIEIVSERCFGEVVIDTHTK